MNEEKSRETRASIRRQQRKSSLVEAVEAELDETGLEGATLERVGQRVGLSKAALYYYIDSRDDLLTLVLEDVLQQQRETAERLGVGSASPLAKLRAFFAHGHVSVIVSRPAGRMIVGHLELLASHQKSTLLLQQQDLYARAIIKQAVDCGELREIPPVIASAVFFGTLNTVPRTFDESGPMSLEQVVDAVLDMLLAGWGEIPVQFDKGDQRGWRLLRHILLAMSAMHKNAGIVKIFLPPA